MRAHIYIIRWCNGVWGTGSVFTHCLCSVIIVLSNGQGTPCVSTRVVHQVPPPEQIHRSLPSSHRPHTSAHFCTLQRGSFLNTISSFHSREGYGHSVVAIHSATAAQLFFIVLLPHQDVSRCRQLDKLINVIRRRTRTLPGRSIVAPQFTTESSQPRLHPRTQIRLVHARADAQPDAPSRSLRSRPFLSYFTSSSNLLCPAH